MTRFARLTSLAPSVLVALALLVATLAPAALADGRSIDDLLGDAAEGALAPRLPRELAFGPDGLLLFLDGNTIHAVDTEDRGRAAGRRGVRGRVPGVGSSIAQKLGCTVAQLQIVGMALNPASGRVYVSAGTRTANRNAPEGVRILVVDGDGTVEALALDAVRHASVSIEGQVQIYDLVYHDGRVYAPGMNREQFASEIFMVDAPFQGASATSFTSSIYHTSHRAWETRAPWTGVCIYTKGREDYLIATSACTPVMRFAIADIEAGEEIEGTTVCEVGAGNRGWNLVPIRTGRDETLLVLNNSRYGIIGLEDEILAEGTDVNEETSMDHWYGMGRGQQVHPKRLGDAFEGVYLMDRIPLGDRDRIVALKVDGDRRDISLVLLDTR